MFLPIHKCLSHLYSSAEHLLIILNTRVYLQQECNACILGLSWLNLSIPIFKRKLQEQQHESCILKPY